MAFNLGSILSSYNKPVNPVQLGASMQKPGISSSARSYIESLPTGPQDKLPSLSGSAPVTGGNPSATAPATPKQNYINSVSQTPATLGGSSSSSTASPTAAAPSTPTAPVKDPYKDAFEKYYATLLPSEAVTNASKDLSDIQSDIFSTSYDSRKRYEGILDRDFGTVGGARESATLDKRRSDSNLADLAVRENAAANTLGALTGAQGYKSAAEKARYEYEQGLYGDSREDKKNLNQPFELSEGQSRYEFDPATGKYKETAAKGKTYAPSTTGSGGGSFNGTLSPLAQAVQNGTIPITSLPSADRAKVAAELAQSGINSPHQEALKTDLQVIDDLLATDTNAITGLGQNPLNAAGLTNQKSINLYNQLKGILSLENRQQLKGSGAISDFEFRVLADAASSLGRNLSNADFKQTLNDIRDVFQGKYAYTRQTSASSPSATPGSLSGGSQQDDPLGLFQ